MMTGAIHYALQVCNKGCLHPTQCGISVLPTMNTSHAAWEIHGRWPVLLAESIQVHVQITCMKPLYLSASYTYTLLFLFEILMTV